MPRKTLRRSKTVTEKQVAANQANATKSTGPKTERGKQVSSQNHFKHGFYAQLHPEVTVVLHEDALEKVRILTGITRSYEIATPAHQMVADDIFDLRWQRIQVTRSWQAKLGLGVKAVERQRDRMHLQINHDVGDIPQAEMLEKGLRNIPDSPAKFGVLIDKLNALVQQAEARDYSRSLPYLTAIYGKQASPRGATIFNLFLDLGRLQREREEALQARRPWPPPGDPVWDDEDAPKKSDPPGYDPRLDQPPEALLMYLNMELHEVQMFYSFFVEDKIAVTQMNRDAAIAPTMDTLTAARVLWIIDRDLDAKHRLLMKMLAEDRKRRLLRQQDQEAEERATAKAAGNRGPSRAQGGPNGARPQADGEARQAVEEEPNAAGSEEDSGEEAAPDAPPGAAASSPPRHGGKLRKEAEKEVEPSDAPAEADAEPDETPEVPGSPFVSGVGTASLLILALVLHFVLSLTHVSLATVSLAHEPAARTWPLPVEAGLPRHLSRLTQKSAAGTPPPHVETGLSRHLSRLTPKSEVGKPPLRVPKHDVFLRTEATDLLKTKDRAFGTNPLRTHWTKTENAGQEEAAGGGDEAPSVPPGLGP